MRVLSNLDPSDMKITALDIKKQEFERSFRGYDPEEVDSFLHVLASAWQELSEDMRRANDRIQEQQLKLEHYMKVEEALEEALQTARSSARQTIESAEKKATDLLEEAENRIVELQKEADSRRLDVKRETARYAVKQQEIVAKLRAFLVSEMEILSHFDTESGDRTLTQGASVKEIELVRDLGPEADSGDGLGEIEPEVIEPASGELAAQDFEDSLVEAAPEEETYVEESATDELESIELESDLEIELEADSLEENSSEPVDFAEDEEFEELAPDHPVEVEEEQAVEGHLSDELDSEDGSDWDDEVSEAEETEEEKSPWKVTPVFESVEDADDAHQAMGTRLPDESADDEIKKIHEILKGLDNEQDQV